MKKLMFLLIVFFSLFSFFVIASLPPKPIFLCYDFEIGQVRNIGDTNIKLVRVESEGSVTLEINGKLETIHDSKIVGCLSFTNKEVNYNLANPENSSAIIDIIKKQCMTWKDDSGKITREQLYERDKDLCSGYRCFDFDGLEVRPACYSLEECNDICNRNRKCVSIKGETFSTVEGNIFEFLDSLVRSKKRHTIAVGDDAPSTDIIAANKIFLKFQDYSNLEAVSKVELVSRTNKKDELILIGHPCDNRLITSVSCENWPYKKGQALIKLSEEGLIVAGSTKEGTLKASEIIANYRNHFDRLRSNKEWVISYKVADNEIEIKKDIKDETKNERRISDENSSFFVCGDGICSRDEICEIDCETEINCINGCLDANDNCIPISVRIGDLYCDIDKEFKDQLKENAFCNNNYECSSNLCIDNQCIEKDLFQKILSWFKRIFG